MSGLELLLVPIYILAFYLYILRKARKMPEPFLRKYFIRGFWLKMVASILFMIYYTYLTGGDTRSLFYTEGSNLFRLLLKDGNNWGYIFSKGTEFNEHLVGRPWNFGYYRQESNFMIIRLTALLSFITFGYYTLIGLFFAMFAYLGLWRLFQFFYEQRPELHKAFAISILFFPSVVFWSSGLIKDSITMGALGWFTLAMFRLLNGKQIFKNVLIIGISVYLISAIKVYILLAYAPFFTMYLFLLKLKIVKAVFLRLVITCCILIGITFVFSQTYSSYEDELDQYAVENLTSTITSLNEVIEVRTGRADAESNFNLGAQFDGTFSGLIKIAPYALVATFYRPFIWETSKVSQLMAAVESLFMIYFTMLILFKAGPVRVIKYILSDKLIVFCLLFALVFGLFVGSSTLNFGSLVRYKIPCMPFYAIVLFLLYDKLKKRKIARKELLESKVHTPSFASLSLSAG